MTSMNRQLNFPEMRQIMSDFERQGEIMDMKEEVIDGVIHDTLGDKGEEEQTETIVQQVLICRCIWVCVILYFRNFRSLTSLAFKWESNWEICRQPKALWTTK